MASVSKGGDGSSGFIPSARLHNMHSSGFSAADAPVGDCILMMADAWASWPTLRCT